jgi:hypothetical protein
MKTRIDHLVINAFIQKASISLGTPELISRGEARWYFGVPDDGRLIAGGMLPCSSIGFFLFFAQKEIRIFRPRPRRQACGSNTVLISDPRKHQ